MSAHFEHLFSEIALGACVLRNRIVSTGHHTYLSDGAPDERLVAYHEARARGGVGLVVSEVVAVHRTAGFSSSLLDAGPRAHIPAFARLADACHRHGARLFAQLFHPGREILSVGDGMLPVAYAPSAVPNERFHIMPRPMSRALIADVIAGYAQAAAHLCEAGFDGVEVVASHGYLPAQFLNPRVNLRDDEYGGDETGRLRFLREVLRAVRAAAGDLVLGLRISADELDADGLGAGEVAAACEATCGELDYLSVVAGTSASLAGSVHITPPMGFASGYVAPLAADLRRRCRLPLMVTGRINQPQDAERLIARGEADLCGMTRALICDPLMPAKARAGQLDDIRACIGCNQACIGRAHKGHGISCIQYPESGRETRFGELPPADRPRRIMVVGGGPAGMKAAAVAAVRGHEVTLWERERALGGQVLLAQRLPGRDEFGGIVQNLAREMASAGVRVRTGVEVDAQAVAAAGAERVVLATGARDRRPSLPGLNPACTVTAWDVLRERVAVGARVVVADWRADWIGIGVAERLARAGSAVTLCVNAALAGETLPLYTRNHHLRVLQRLGVPVRTHLRLFGADGRTVWFQHTLSEEAVEQDDVDTLVLSLGHRAEDALASALEARGIAFDAIGDCVAPRTAEEAVYEGLVTGCSV